MDMDRNASLAELRNSYIEQLQIDAEDSDADES